MMLNKEPIYLQINRVLRNLIIDDNYSIGDQFLTERAICEKFGVSRATANKSLSSLVSENILEFKKGIGTFIKSTPDSPFASSFWHDPISYMEKNKKTFQTKLIENTILKNPITDILKNSDQIYYLKRSVSQSATIIALEEIFIIEQMSGLFDDASMRKSLCSIIKDQTIIKLDKTTDLIKSRISTNEETDLFHQLEPITIMEIDSTSYSAGNIPIFFTRKLFNSEYVSIRINNQQNEIILNS